MSFLAGSYGRFFKEEAPQRRFDAGVIDKMKISDVTETFDFGDRIDLTGSHVLDLRMIRRTVEKRPCQVV